MQERTGLGLVIGAVALVATGAVIWRGRQAKNGQGGRNGDKPSRGNGKASARVPRFAEVAPGEAFYLEVLPLPRLADGTDPVISSAHYEENPSRKRHTGVDMMWPRLPQHVVPFEVGDGGAAERFWVPRDAPILAVAPGVVTVVGEMESGLRVWIDHGEWRSGYFHMASARVAVGDTVVAGQVIGLVGHNPYKSDPLHLHFVLSPSKKWKPINGGPYVREAAENGRVVEWSDAQWSMVA